MLLLLTSPEIATPVCALARNDNENYAPPCKAGKNVVN